MEIIEVDVRVDNGILALARAECRVEVMQDDIDRPFQTLHKLDTVRQRLDDRLEITLLLLQSEVIFYQVLEIRVFPGVHLSFEMTVDECQDLKTGCQSISLQIVHTLEEYLGPKTKIIDVVDVRFLLLHGEVRTETDLDSFREFLLINY